jgi:putative transposase
MHRSHREEKDGLMWRVEPICKVLNFECGVSISPSGYHAHKVRPPSARSVRDSYLAQRIATLWEDNYSCWGVMKVWRRLCKDGEKVARCTVARLMRTLGIYGLSRAKARRTTIAGKGAKGAKDLVRRNFHADAPNRLWVADFTYVSTWEGWCYTAFVTDAFARRIIGWAVSTRMNRDLVADAFKMAVFNRSREGRDDFSDLIHHNDKGSQYTADDFIELLALHGIRASIGSVGDSYDNALAESVNGGYKTELIRNPMMGPWRDVGQLRLKTAEWVHWHNDSNISERNGWHTPIEIEDMLYNDGVDARKGPKNGKQNSPRNPG